MKDKTNSFFSDNLVYETFSKMQKLKQIKYLSYKKQCDKFINIIYNKILSYNEINSSNLKDEIYQKIKEIIYNYDDLTIFCEPFKYSQWFALVDKDDNVVLGIYRNCFFEDMMSGYTIPVDKAINISHPPIAGNYYIIGNNIIGTKVRLMDNFTADEIVISFKKMNIDIGRTINGKFEDKYSSGYFADYICRIFDRNSGQVKWMRESSYNNRYTRIFEKNVMSEYLVNNGYISETPLSKARVLDNEEYNRCLYRAKNYDRLYNTSIDKIQKEIIEHNKFNKVSTKLFDRFNTTIKNLDGPMLEENICRKLVLSKRQFKMSRTSCSYAGMHATSDIGKRRNSQEDGYLILTHPKNKEFKLMVVADGVGGRYNGELASNEALVETIKWFEALDEKLYYDTSKFKVLWSEKIREINNLICQYNDGRATTYLGAAILENDTVVKNIGDSRAFIYTTDGNLLNTKDHSRVYEYFKSKKIKYLDDTRFHYEANIVTKILGNYCDDEEKFEDTYVSKNCNLEKIVLCTDGVTDCLSQDTILNILKTCDDFVDETLVFESLLTNSYCRDELYNLYEYNNEIIAGKDNTTAVSYVYTKKLKRF